MRHRGSPEARHGWAGARPSGGGLGAMWGPPGQKTRGFTLLEVLVALAILSLAVVASIQGFAQGLRLLKLAGEHQQAILLADEKAREVLTLEPGRDTGTDGGFAWERTVKTLKTPDLDVSGRSPRWHVYEIDVRVTWGGHREVQVATLRTGPEGGQTATPAPGRPGAPGGPGR